MFLAFYRGFHKRSFANVITWLIRTLTGGPYSHVAIVFGDGAAAEASGRPLFRKTAGVRWVPASNLTYGDWDLIAVAATERDEAVVSAFVARHIGGRFDWPAVLRFIMPWIKPSPGKWFCTGFALKALQAAGLARNVPADICPNGLIRTIQDNSEGLFVCGNSNNCRCLCSHQRYPTLSNDSLEYLANNRLEKPM